MKYLILYPLTKPSSQKNPKHNSFSLDGIETKYQELQLVLTMGKDLYFKNEIEDDTINTFISRPHAVRDPTWHFLESIMSYETQETIRSETKNENIPVTKFSDSIPMEIEPRKTLNINPSISSVRLSNS